MTKFIKSFMLVSGVIGLLVSPPVFAQDAVLQPDSETPISRLQANCDKIHSTLRRIHTHDALLRVNIGQMYNGISVRLMARLNSRLALNRIDSSKLVEISNRFEEYRKGFTDSYSKYEAALSTVIRGGCKTYPAKFYEDLLTARSEREILAQNVKSMNDSIIEYQVAVEQLKQDLSADTPEADDATN